MIIAGAVTFGSLYFISPLVAAAGADSSSGSNPTAPMWIPAVGPFVQMFTTESATANVFLAIDGIGQSAGLAMFIYGITSPVHSEASRRPRFVVDPDRPLGAQAIPLRIDATSSAEIAVFVDGRLAARGRAGDAVYWSLTRGPHEIVAESGGIRSDAVSIRVD